MKTLKNLSVTAFNQKEKKDRFLFLENDEVVPEGEFVITELQEKFDPVLTNLERQKRKINELSSRIRQRALRNVLSESAQVLLDHFGINDPEARKAYLDEVAFDRPSLVSNSINVKPFRKDDRGLDYLFLLERESLDDMGRKTEEAIQGRLKEIIQEAYEGKYGKGQLVVSKGYFDCYGKARFCRVIPFVYPKDRETGNCSTLTIDEERPKFVIEAHEILSPSNQNQRNSSFFEVAGDPTKEELVGFIKSDALHIVGFLDVLNNSFSPDFISEVLGEVLNPGESLDLGSAEHHSGYIEITGVVLPSGKFEIYAYHSGEYGQNNSSFVGASITLKGLYFSARYGGSCETEDLEVLTEEEKNYMAQILFPINEEYEIDEEEGSEISEEKAQGILEGFNRLNACDLKLDMECISGAVADIFSKFNGDSIVLDNLRFLSPTAAESFSKSRVESLSFNAVETLSDEATEHLSKFQGRWSDTPILCLKGLKNISDTGIGFLAKFEGDLNVSDKIQARIEAYKSS